MSEKPSKPLEEQTLPAGPEALSQVEPDDVDIGLLSIVGLFIAVVVFLIVVLCQAWFYDWKNDVATGRSAATDVSQMPLSQAVVEQESQINSYRWVSRDKGIRAIPIERAMELMTKELAAEPTPAKEEGKP